MHKDIFQLVKESNNFKNDAKRIIALFEQDNFVWYDGCYYSIKDFVSAYLFIDWKNKDHCKDLSDFLTSCKYVDARNYFLFEIKNPMKEQWLYLVLVETIYNMCSMFEQCADSLYFKLSEENGKLFSLLKYIMDDSLNSLNYEYKYFEDEDFGVVVKKSASVDCVIDVLNEKLIKPVILYNHFRLEGNIEEKRKILELTYHEWEKDKKNSTADNKLKSDLSNMYNNLGIRHNNDDPDSPKFNNKLDKITDKKRESLYDKLYNLFILVYLLDDYRNGRDEILNYIEK